MYGNYLVENTTIYLGGMTSNNGDNQYGALFYPSNGTSNQKYPFISFAHGMGAGGSKMTLDYGTFLRSSLVMGL